MLQDKYVVGVDIGGTHISAAVIDANKWEIFAGNVVRNHVFSQEEAKSILQSWADTLRTTLTLSPDPIRFIGIAMPGPFDYDEGISKINGQSKYDSLYLKNVKEMLADELELPKDSIHFINDAAAFLQGEIFAQNLQSEERILGITLGTGLGSAVWNKGDKAYDADLWNTAYAESIFEEYLVTRWFVNRFKALTGQDVTGLKQILDNHRESDAFATLRDEYASHLFEFLSFFSEKYQCDRFIIGGNIAKALPQLIGQRPSFDRFKITTAILGEKAAMIGAASIFDE